MESRLPIGQKTVFVCVMCISFRSGEFIARLPLKVSFTAHHRNTTREQQAYMYVAPQRRSKELTMG